MALLRTGARQMKPLTSSDSRRELGGPLGLEKCAPLLHRLACVVRFGDGRNHGNAVRTSLQDLNRHRGARDQDKEGRTSM